MGNAPVSKPEVLSSIPRTQMEKRTDSAKLSAHLHVCAVVRTCHTQNKYVLQCLENTNKITTIKDIKRYFFFILVCMHTHKYHSTHVEIRNNLWDLFPKGPKDQIQVMRHGSKCLYLLTHLNGPRVTILSTKKGIDWLIVCQLDTR